MARVAALAILLMGLNCAVMGSLYPETLKPRVSCVRRVTLRNGKTGCELYLGYENPQPEGMSVPKGFMNRVHGPPSLHTKHAHINSNLPEWFEPGVHDAQFSIIMSCPEAHNSKWTLGRTTLTFREYMDVECPKDCTGSAFGTAQVDECGVCGGHAHFNLLSATSFYDVAWEVHAAPDTDGLWCLGDSTASNLDAHTRLPSSREPHCSVNVFEVAVRDNATTPFDLILSRSSENEGAWEGYEPAFQPLAFALPFVAVGRFMVASRVGPLLELEYDGEVMVYLDGVLRDKLVSSDGVQGMRSHSKIYIEAEDAHPDGSPILVEIFIGNRDGYPRELVIQSFSDLHTCLCKNMCGLCNQPDSACEGGQSFHHLSRRDTEKRRGNWPGHHSEDDEQRRSSDHSFDDDNHREPKKDDHSDENYKYNQKENDSKDDTHGEEDSKDDYHSGDSKDDHGDERHSDDYYQSGDSKDDHGDERHSDDSESEEEPDTACKIGHHLRKYWMCTDEKKNRRVSPCKLYNYIKKGARTGKCEQFYPYPTDVSWDCKCGRNCNSYCDHQNASWEHIDFEELNSGDVVDDFYETRGLKSVRTTQQAAHPAMVFNSSFPTGGDTDLGSPHSDFGGPGMGVGGAMGSAHENSIAHGNVLIVSEDGDSSDPDDNAGGGTLVFEFTHPVYVDEVHFLDIERASIGGIQCVDGSGGLLKSTDVPQTGDNGYAAVEFGARGCSKLKIVFKESGAVTFLSFYRYGSKKVKDKCGVCGGDGSSCDNNCRGGCDDDDVCTVDECVHGKCVHTPKDCDDGNDCTIDECNHYNGQCQHWTNTHKPECVTPTPSRLPSASETRPPSPSSTPASTPSASETSPPSPSSTPASTPSASETSPPSPSSTPASTPSASETSPPSPSPTPSETVIASPSHSPQRTCHYGCDDNNPCTIDECVNGECTHIPKNCDDGNDCTIDECNHYNGQCQHWINTHKPECVTPTPSLPPSASETRPPSPSSTPSEIIVASPSPSAQRTCHYGCDDNNLCTIDKCVDGECTHWPKNCDDGNACTLDLCNSYTGRCEHHINMHNSDCVTPTPTPTPPYAGCPYSCEDGNPCTDDRCVDGVCRHIPKNCDDGDECTLDSCSRASGRCVHVRDQYNPSCILPTPSPCPPTCPHDCYDGNKCTVDECIDGVCRNWPKDCDDGNECTTDSCNPYTGTCVHAHNAYDEQCAQPSASPAPPPCYPGDHHIAINISVEHSESLNISCGAHHTFKFEYCVTQYNDSAVVIGFDPYTTCHIGARGGCDNRPHDGADGDECRFFDPNYPLAQRWTSHRHGGLICFVAHFSVEDLLGCRTAYDPHTPLVIKKSGYDDVDIKGTLYTTTLSGQHCYINGVCEPTLLGSSYDFHITIDTHGRANAVFFKSDIQFEARWAKTLWLSDGNVHMFVDTCINQLDSYADTHALTKLVNPTLNSSAETGRPMSFVTTEAECAAFHLPYKCCQRWELGTHDVHGGDEVSGVKPLSWDVMSGTHLKLPLYVFLDLGVSRSPQKLWKGGSLGSDLTLYKDRWFDVRYNPGDKDTFIDCEIVYGLLHVDSLGSRFWLAIQSARLCIPQTGSAVSYDPDHPDVTGCNTPGVDMECVTLFDKESGFVNEEYGYQNLRNPPDGAYKAGFSFVAKARSRYGRCRLGDRLG